MPVGEAATCTSLQGVQKVGYPPTPLSTFFFQKKRLLITDFRCIPKMDHHCPWTSNCVSHTTFPHFIRFLFYAVASMSYLSYFLYTRSAMIWNNRHLPIVCFPASSIKCYSHSKLTTRSRHMARKSGSSSTYFCSAAPTSSPCSPSPSSSYATCGVSLSTPAPLRGGKSNATRRSYGEPAISAAISRVRMARRC